MASRPWYALAAVLALTSGCPGQPGSLPVRDAGAGPDGPTGPTIDGATGPVFDAAPGQPDGTPPVPDAAPLPPVVFPGANWETRSPEQVGLNSSLLNQFAAIVGGDGCIIRDGYLVKSWGNPASSGDWASASKPVSATMLMFAMVEGKLAGFDDPISNWGWALNSADQSMTFRHLANMMSGYSRAEGPGQAWAYNDYGIMLYVKTIFDKVYNEGSPNTAAMNANRLGALGFQDGDLYGSRGGYGVDTSPRDFARIGWFWLNKGRWGDRQMIPVSYFDELMKPGVPGNLPRTSGGGSDYLGVGTLGGGSDQFAYGPGIYGINWWFNAPVGTGSSITWPDAPADTFQANGHWNVEVVTIIPSLNMVVAARGNWGSFEPGNAGASMNQYLKLLVSAATN